MPLPPGATLEVTAQAAGELSLEVIAPMPDAELRSFHLRIQVHANPERLPAEDWMNWRGVGVHGHRRNIAFNNRPAIEFDQGTTARSHRIWFLAAGRYAYVIAPDAEISTPANVLRAIELIDDGESD
jgi:hypothetical protein